MAWGLLWCVCHGVGLAVIIAGALSPNTEAMPALRVALDLAGWVMYWLGLYGVIKWRIKEERK